MNKLLQILTSPVAVSILYSVVSIYGVWSGVDYLIESEPTPEVIPVYRIISYEDAMKAMQGQIDEMKALQIKHQKTYIYN